MIANKNPIPKFVESNSTLALKLESSEWNLIAESVNNSKPLSDRSGEDLCTKYLECIESKSNLTKNEKQNEYLDKPFDFFDDEEFAFGINLLNNNVACVGENISKLMQLAQEPWPENVKLYQPYEVEQILLPDNASCLSVQAFLKMCNLPFEVEMRWNAEFMSPSGRVPFIKCGAFVISELEPIVHFVANKGVSLCHKLSSEEKAEMRAYMSLITNVLVNAELYVSWVDDDTFNSVTKIRNGSVYPWPLGWFQTRSKRGMVIKRLKALHWHDKSMEQVFSDVEQCCNSLSQRLGEKDFFFGTPTPLDALVYGHVRALMGFCGPKAPYLIKHITSVLLKHTLRIANLTQMALTKQEEYLISQAFSIVQQRRLSPERKASERNSNERNSRRKSRMSYTSSSPEKYTDTSATALNTLPITENYIQRDVPDSNSIDIDKFKEAKNTDSMLTLSDILPEMDNLKCDDGSKTIEESKSEDQFVETGGDNESKENDLNLSDAVIIEPPLSFYNKHGDYLDTIMEIEQTEASNSDQDEVINNLPDSSVGVEVDIDSMNKKSKNDTSLEDEEFKENSILLTRPTELDALVFGHVFTIITTRLPSRRLAEIVKKYSTLVALAKRVDEMYFRRP